MKKDKLILMTNEFPFGNQETFLEEEIKVLSAAFERIIIISMNGHGPARGIPPNVMYYSLDDLPSSTKSLSEWCSVYIKGAMMESTWWNYIFHCIAFGKYVTREYEAYSKVKKFFNSDFSEGNWIGYSYWYLSGCLALTFLKKEKLLSKAISRVHGYDLYDIRQGGHIPFRQYKISQLDTVVTISAHGKEYLSKRVNSPEKIGLSYLGTADHGLAPFEAAGIFRIVSCSNVIPIKRVERIAEAINLLKFNVEWVHFGDGICLDEVESIMKECSDNISYDFKGRVSNNDLMKFYQNTSVNLFINVSSTEGLPVSMMEAISFGIPVIGTNVGGVSEIINDQTGRLLPEDISPVELSGIIEAFKASGMNSATFRKGVREFWCRHFISPDCYYSFVEKFLR